MRRPAAVLPLALTPLILLGGCSTKDVQTVNAADSIEVRPPARSTAAASTRDSSGSDAGSPIGVSSQGGDVVEYYTAATLAHVGDSLARGVSTGHMIRGRPTYQYLQIRRGRNGVPEVHDRWTDVTMVQAGRATLLSGGHVSGSHVEGAGEHRGGTIIGGSSRPVGNGDLMIIPAGVPHQYLIAAGDTLRYITVKVLKAADAH